MARIDDFKQAKEISKKDLLKHDPEVIARYAGCGIKRPGHEIEALILKFLNRDIIISWPDMGFSYDEGDGEISIQQQAFLLHYLKGAFSSGGTEISNEWVSYQDIPDGRFYMDAFIKRAKDPLIKTFGFMGVRMVEVAAQAYGASRLELGDYSVKVQALPFVPVALLIWEGDEEFPPDGNLLFDKTISAILSAEDIATLAGMVVYPMIGMVYK
ncbi:MAG: DUF3786 domain-containing protein [Deltaproteobacteria bacterium]|nr:DUF3786 domain-containing protein [Deltaproteobacteria bacterium]